MFSVFICSSTIFLFQHSNFVWFVHFVFNFTDENFCKLLAQSPRTASGNECLQDIYDGSLYKEHISQEDSFLRCPWNISFTLNTDGVNVFSSSKKGHFWPVYLAINELPIEQR